MKHYIRTFSGGFIVPTDPDPAAIRIEDIAHALSMNCRFCGHTRWHYSVAQHSVYCALAAWAIDPSLALPALLHDASEAYLADIASPVKRSGKIDQYLEVEAALERAIAEAFGFSHPRDPRVKVIDNRMLATEIRDLLPNDEPLPYEPFDFPIARWSPRHAKMQFLSAYHLFA